MSFFVTRLDDVVIDRFYVKSSTIFIQFRFSPTYLDSLHYWYTCGIREAIEIRGRKPELNEDGRFHIKPIYDNIIESRDDEGQRGYDIRFQIKNLLKMVDICYYTEIDRGTNNKFLKTKFLKYSLKFTIKYKK